MVCRVEREDFRAAGDADDAVDGAKICGKSAVVGRGTNDEFGETLDSVWWFRGEEGSQGGFDGV